MIFGNSKNKHVISYVILLIFLVTLFIPGNIVTAEAIQVKSQPVRPPSMVKASTAGVKSITIRWTPVKNAGSYEIYRKGKKGRYQRIAAVGKATYYFIDKKRATGKYYYYKVRARYGSKYSSFSTVVLAKTKPLATTVKLKSGEEKITLSWKKVSSASGYRIYRQKKNGKYERIKTIKKNKTTKYTDKKLKGNKTYTYKVRAYKSVKGKKIYASYSKPVKLKAGKVNLKYNKKHKFYYKKKITVKAYAYTGGGRTKIGTKARVGAIAVDPKLIPLKTKVYVDGYGYANAEDTGGNIKGKVVDLYKSSNRACIQWGVRYKTIYIGVQKKK